ncbi:MAG: MptD family putative ECF transporter S component [Candidatus Woesearchaeota archaeon]|nr:MptD family putative ECF transporter S component [Candidatus Woesearchaeota archaeon]
MFQKFTTRELVFIALMAASLFVVNLVLASGIVAATGIPLASGFLTGITIGLWALLMIKIVPKVGSLTLLFLIYSILEIPTSLGGAPGFWPKIPINAISALIGDLFLYFTRYRNWSIFIAFYVIAVFNIGTFIYFLWLFGLPNVEKTLAIAHYLVLAYWVLGTIGILIGFTIYKRIKNKRTILQIRS